MSVTPEEAEANLLDMLAKADEQALQSKALLAQAETATYEHKHRYCEQAQVHATLAQYYAQRALIVVTAVAAKR